MAQKSYKVGEAIEIIYQTQNAASGVVVNMEVYDEAHIIVAGGPTILTELGASGRYYANFIPNAEGEWSVQIEQVGGIGKATKSFSVGIRNIQDVGAKVDIIDNSTTTLGTNLGIVEGKVDIIIGNQSSPSMIG